MRASTVGMMLLVVVVFGAALVAAHTRVTYILQGMADEPQWVYWTNNHSSTIANVVPTNVVIGIGLGSICPAILLGLWYNRRRIWMMAATNRLPESLTRTPVGLFLETWLTDNHNLQRRALAYMPPPPATRSLADFGCGGAVYLKKLKDIHRSGFDINPSRLKIAERYCDRVFQGDVVQWAKEAWSGFDVALCFEVVEHLTDERGDELLRSLVERYPLVILTTPREFFRVARDGYERHLSFWPAERLARYGFELKETVDVPPSNIYVYVHRPSSLAT